MSFILARQNYRCANRRTNDKSCHPAPRAPRCLSPSAENPARHPAAGQPSQQMRRQQRPDPREPPFQWHGEQHHRRTRQPQAERGQHYRSQRHPAHAAVAHSDDDPHANCRYRAHCVAEDQREDRTDNYPAQDLAREGGKSAARDLTRHRKQGEKQIETERGDQRPRPKRATIAKLRPNPPAGGDRSCGVFMGMACRREAGCAIPLTGEAKRWASDSRRAQCCCWSPEPDAAPAADVTQPAFGRISGTDRTAVRHSEPITATQNVTGPRAARAWHGQSRAARQIGRRSLLGRSHPSHEYRQIQISERLRGAIQVKTQWHPVVILISTA